MGYSEPISTFISRKSIDLCISGIRNDEIINGFFTFLKRTFSDINCLPTQCYLYWGRKRCNGVVKIAFDKEDVKSKPHDTPVNKIKSMDSGNSILIVKTCCSLWPFKVALQPYWNHTSAWVFSCKFASYFQNTFS